MSKVTYQNRPPSLYRGEIPYQRSHIPFLRHIQAISEQRCLTTANGVLGYQGAGKYSRGCYHGY